MDNYRPSIGTPVQQLDTPCFLIDLDALEHNFDVIADTYRDTICKMREHSKNIKSPIVARMQIRAGGTVGGVCAAKVSEAEIMVEGGIGDILITNQVVTRDKIARLCALAQHADVKVAIDHPRNLRELSEIADAYGATVGIIIEVDTSMHRGGIRSVKEGVELAKLAVELPAVAFRGVMSHQTLGGKPSDRETRFTEGRRYIQMCLDVKDAIEAEGIAVEIVSSGETWTVDVAPTIAGVTEVEGGTYALMNHGNRMGEVFEVAGKVVASVISTPRPGIAIGDAGSRALGGTLPLVEGVPGVRVEALQDEHIVLRSEGAMPLERGDQFLLQPGHQDMIVSRWDRFIAVRNDRVAAVWDVSARGCYH
jgi:3-hydroxy-D-aspartate aldolase